MKLEKSLKNITAAVLSQLVTVILGFIIPRITLVNYGSETNGYMSLVTQIYAYIALLEAGLGTTMVQALYAPITNSDKGSISGIVNAARVYYRKLAFGYAGVVLIISFILPWIINSELASFEIASYFLLFGVSNVINFFFTASMRPILLAEGKNYVNSHITTVFHLLSQFAKILLLYIGVNIVILQAVYSIINILQIIVYYIYFKHNYKWLDKKEKPLFDKLKQRNAFFLQQVSNLVFSCTDMVIISIFCDLKMVSVYTVYLFIYNTISILLSLFSSSTSFILGQTYNENKATYISIHRGYESALIGLAFAFFAVAYVLGVPFVKLYTVGVEDINYVDALLPLLFSLNGMLSTCKTVPNSLINFSYHAKQTMGRTLFEAFINLGVSLILAPFFGVHGILIGTTIALVYRVIDLIFYTNHLILKTSIFKSVRLYLANFLLFGLIVAGSSPVSISLNSYWEFIFAGVLTSIVVFVLYFVLNVAIDIKQSKMMFGFLKKKLLKR